MILRYFWYEEYRMNPAIHLSDLAFPMFMLTVPDHRG